MSNEALVVMNSNPLAVLNQGGLGLDAVSRLFQVKPATLEIVQSSSKQENVQIGKFRDTSTNVHFEEIQVVLLAMPIEQRQLYKKGNEFSRDAKLCFSLDNVKPHDRAKEPQAPFCATCPKGDIGWAKWRKTNDPADIPQCKKYWHLFLADRKTQMPYYFNVKGTGVQQFEFDMQKLARLLVQLEANAKATPENKEIAAKNRAIMEENSKLTDQSQWKSLLPYVKMPNIFDITFTMVIQKHKSGGYIPVCKDFMVLNEQGKKEFGELYLDFIARKQQGMVQDQLAAEAETEDSAVTGAPAEAPKPAENAAVIGTATPLQGEVVGAKPVITI